MRYAAIAIAFCLASRLIASEHTYSTDLCNAGTAIASHGVQSQIDYAFDNNTTSGNAYNITEVVSPNVWGNQWIGYQFATAKDIRKIRLLQGGAAFGNSWLGVTSVTIQYSDNGSTWNLAQTFSGLHTSTTWDDLILNTSSGTHPYWRLLANANPAAGTSTASWAVKEIEMMEDTTQPYDPESTFQDTDGDGIPNHDDTDDDGDGIDDRWDSTPGDTDTPSTDTDGDGQDDGFEFDNGTDPNDPNSHLNPNLSEIDIQTDGNGRIISIAPIDPNTGEPIAGYNGADGMGDGNNNGISDWQELYWGKDPFAPSNLKDTDKDGWADDTETKFGWDPNNPAMRPYEEWQPSDGTPDEEAPTTDTDGDGMTDLLERQWGSNWNNPTSKATDSDGDGVPDTAERYVGTNPNSAASKPPEGYDTSQGPPPIENPEGDNDLDGASNWEEWQAGTDPNDPTSIPENPDDLTDAPPINEDEASDDKDALQQCYEALGLNFQELENFEAQDYSVDIALPIGGTIDAPRWQHYDIQLNPQKMAESPMRSVAIYTQAFIRLLCTVCMSIYFFRSIWDLLWDL